MPTAYTIRTTVEGIREEDGLWYVHFAGSRESIALGTEPLVFAVGDRVKITIQKETNDA